MTLSKAEAQKLTEQIKDNLNQSARLIQKAHEGQIWKPLGLNSFAEWLKNTLGISRARGYQLLNIAKVEDQVRALLPVPEHFILTERQTRAIAAIGVEKACEQAEQMTEDERHLWSPYGVTEVEANYQSLVEVINEHLVPNEEPHPDLPHAKPTDNNETALSFYSEFLYQIEDLPKTDEVEPADYPQMIKDLEATVKRIDELVNDYLGAEGGK